jgi:transglutaminase-like putative cysteine protease
MSHASYRVEHETRYLYTSGVSTSQHLAYLRPRELPWQRVRAHELSIDPWPARASERVDYFGNAVSQFTVLGPHAELSVRSQSLVQVRARPAPIAPALSPPWETVRDAFAYRTGAPAGEPAQYAYASPYVEPDPELADFAGASFGSGRPFLEAAIGLMHRIHTEFRFDPRATSITTPVRRVLAERRGVCQDFAHLLISCLRSLGLAARYLSGYLLTDPPPGQPRLTGADASHAWVSVPCPHHGWVDLDPTNDVVPGLRHITLAWGRDYGDVSPLRGVILGGTQQTLHVGVNVTPLAAAGWDNAPWPRDP